MKQDLKTVTMARKVKEEELKYANEQATGLNHALD